MQDPASGIQDPGSWIKHDNRADDTPEGPRPDRLADGGTALIKAAAKGHLDVVKYPASCYVE